MLGEEKPIELVVDFAAPGVNETLLESIVGSAHDVIASMTSDSGKTLGELFGLVFCLETQITSIVMPLEKRYDWIAELKQDDWDAFGRSVIPMIIAVTEVEAMGMLRLIVGYYQESRCYWARVRVQMHRGAQA